MAKVRARPEANPRSRAARRAGSPSINIDESLKEVHRPDAAPQLGIVRGGGVSKKKKQKQMTRGQRARQEKGLARAEIVMDQLATKKDSSNAKLKRREKRKALWEDINGTITEEKKRPVEHSLQDSRVAEQRQDPKLAHDRDVEMSVNGTVQATTLKHTNQVTSFGERVNSDPNGVIPSVVQDGADLIT